MDEPKHDLADLSFEELEARIAKAGGQRSLARQLGIPRTTIQELRKRARKAMFKHRPAPQARVELVKKGVRRWIVSYAQDETKVHEGFLTNLEAYRDWLAESGECEILIAGGTYNKRLFEEHNPGKRGPYFHERVKPYLVDERIRLGEMVDFCGEMNTNPTAETPLSGFETYTRHRWGIFPHPKVQLRSIATMKHEPTKQIMTTGAVTVPNYVQKRAGIKASFHHVIGAVLVEIAADGRFFARHLIADEDGSFYDLDRYVKDGEVTTGHRVEAINYGDIHTAQIDPEVAKKTFGFYPEGNGVHRTWKRYLGETMLSALRPRYQFFHDVADFQRRNHHNLHDPHLMYALHVQGLESVEGELEEVAMLLSETRQEDCESVVVESNHNLALTRWLKTADWRHDPVNALFFISCTKLCLEAIRDGRKDFSIFEHVIRSFPKWDLTGVRFLKLDESFKVKGIEKGMHGHLGANGARGTPNAFTKMGSKSTTGHTHSPYARDGNWCAGTKSLLDMGYNDGLSSWAHSDVLTYANGKRAMITFCQGDWHL